MCVYIWQVLRRKAADKDKELHPSKVRSNIVCAECGRPRCIFAKNSPGAKLLEALDVYVEGVEYSCGAPLFGEGATGIEKTLADKFYVKENLDCKEPMELNYYNYGGLRGRAEFNHVCAICGNGPEQSPLLSERELGTPEGRTPLPLCHVCYANDKKPVLVKRADQATANLERKEKKQEAKKAIAAEKAAPKNGGAKGARGKAAAAKAAKASAAAAATKAPCIVMVCTRIYILTDVIPNTDVMLKPTHIL